jgi:TRAP transporter 4TM/12TM fusion protein
MQNLSRLSEIRFASIDSGGRKLTGFPALLMMALAICFSLYVFSINSWLLLDLMRRSGVFAGLLLAMVFLLYPATAWSPRDRPTFLDYVLSVLGAAGGFYIWVTYLDFVERNLSLTNADIVFGTITILLALEAGRRALGIWMTALAVIAIAYALYGRAMPYPFGHFGVTPERLLIRMYMVDEGLFGSLLQVAQTYIGLFVLFGAFLTVIGASEALTKIGLALSGQYAGGPAKVAAIASGLTGMISGTAAANVATTGTLTIPMMQRVGFKPYFAGAVEAIASTGGLIMPPIMGAAAFLVAEFVGIPYSVVVIGAIIPALLYYGSLMLVIHIRAVKLGIAGLPRSEIPSLREILIERGHLLIPIAVLLWMLLDGRTPTWAAMMSILAALAVSFLRRATRLTPQRFVDGLINGAAAAVPVSVACLVAGIIVGVVTLTGVAQVFTGYIEMLSGGSLLAALFLTAIASVLLSCALPATAVYIVVAVTIAPALIEMGARPLAAHFFVFWMGVLSNITPPVAIACFTAAGIAGAGPTKVAFAALRMAFPAFIIPFVVVLHPDLLLIEWTAFGLLRTLVMTTVGIAAYVAATEGWLMRPLGMPMRLAFGLVALLCLVIVEPLSGYAGLAIGAGSLVLLLLRRPATESAT